ncbi:MAG: phosphoribosylglycinamide synthetase C domain-containing protein, partial [Acidimicrobiales bacterium]
AVTVVLASAGYPGAVTTGHVIEGLDGARRRPGVTVFEVATGTGADGRAVTAGGRVLDVVGMAPTVAGARATAYDAAARISWPGMHYRRDIAGGLA